MKLFKIQKDTKKATRKKLMPATKMKMKTNLKAGAWDWLLSWPNAEGKKDKE